MAAERQIPGGPFLNETGSNEQQIPGGQFVNESATGGASTQNLTATTLTNASTFGTHVLSPGAAPLTATTLTNTSAFGTHVLSASLAATATTLTNTSTFGTHVLTPGTVTLGASTLTNVSTFGTHVLEGGAGGTQSLTATVLTNASTFGTHVLAPGAAPLTATTLTNSSTFGTHVLSATYTVAASLLTNSSTFGTHVLEQGAAQLVATTLTNTSTFGTHLLTGGASAEEEAATGGWMRARRIRQLDELSKLPTKEQIQAERERLGILPKKAQKAVEKVAERELSSAAADDESLEQAIKEFASGALQERAERAVRNELAARGQPYRREVPGVLRAILADGLRRAAQVEIDGRMARHAAELEEAEVNELLALWIDM